MIDYPSKLIHDWYSNSKKGKIHTKVWQDMITLHFWYTRKGKLFIEYRDNMSSNVTAYINGIPFKHRVIDTLEDIGMGYMFQTGQYNIRRQP